LKRSATLSSLIEELTRSFHASSRHPLRSFGSEDPGRLAVSRRYHPLPASGFVYLCQQYIRCGGTSFPVHEHEHVHVCSLPSFKRAQLHRPMCFDMRGVWVVSRGEAGSRRRAGGAKGTCRPSAVACSICHDGRLVVRRACTPDGTTPQAASADCRTHLRAGMNVPPYESDSNNSSRRETLARRDVLDRRTET
jgi:hypothetical protein